MIEEAYLADTLAPYVSMFIALVISLMTKDIATSVIKGLAFRFNPLFREGDLVIVDGEFAIVVKIGFRNTVFGIEKPNGNYTWLSVENERITYLKIEKVVRLAEGKTKNVEDHIANKIPLDKDKTE